MRMSWVRRLLPAPDTWPFSSMVERADDNRLMIVRFSQWPPRKVTLIGKRSVLKTDVGRKAMGVQVPHLPPRLCSKGKCKICGYNKCVEALEFHHENSNIKHGTPSNMRRMELGKYLDELSLCILVCANCHREIHYKLLGGG
jgi:hypothetical protein